MIMNQRKEEVVAVDICPPSNTQAVHSFPQSRERAYHQLDRTGSLRGLADNTFLVCSYREKFSVVVVSQRQVTAGQALAYHAS